MFHFAKETFFDGKALGEKSNGDKTPLRLLESPGIMAGSLKERSISKNQIQIGSHLLLMNFVIN